MKLLFILALFVGTLWASLLDFKYLEEAKVAYHDKNYTKAQSLYQKVENDEAKFNEADTLYRQKKYKEAIEAYEAITDPKLLAKKLHNIGNSYAQLKKIDEAIDAYEEALKIEDDADTKFNLELLKKKKKEKKKKKDDKKKDDKKDKDKKDDKKKDKKDSEKSEKEKSDKEKSEEQKKKDKESSEKKKKEEDEKKKDDKKKEKPKMNEQNQTQPPISNMEERKWQKMLNQRGVQTLMIPLNKGKKENETTPW